ncbi:MAG: hypothetical protein AB7F35_21025 [Acetobacteraceae bacterium]
MVLLDLGTTRGRWLGILLAGLLLVPCGALRAAPPPAASASAAQAVRTAENSQPLGPLTTSEKQGYGCLVAGGASLALTAMTGASQMVAIFTGAPGVPPVGAAGVGLAVAGTIFASTCAVGALVAPAVERLWRYYYEGAAIRPSP